VAASPPFVVVTGLAAAGKTSVARPLAAILGVPLISKDELTEAMFDALGARDLAWARTLSRAADAALVRIAVSLDAAVLDNYWRLDTVEQLTAAVSVPMVEVHCRVDPEVALARFRGRTRHAGHADRERDLDGAFPREVLDRFPLRTLGPVIEVDAERPVDVRALAGEVAAAYGA
jgi:predicted kinase